jgi:hypothetical protein
MTEPRSWVVHQSRVNGFSPVPEVAEVGSVPILMLVLVTGSTIRLRLEFCVAWMLSQMWRTTSSGSAWMKLI